MALDQQRNWDISMAENLAASKRRREAVTEQEAPLHHTTTTTTSSTDQSTPPPPIYLPDEILIQILNYISHLPTPLSQPTFAACALLSHQWHNASTPYLYAHPRLYGGNYDPFVRAICPSINLHVRQSPLSSLVKTLDMGSLVHQGSKSLTARVLGRTKGNLETFVAPQASFAINCLPALSKCSALKCLDLSLVSESPPLPDLFRTLAHLGELKTLRLPRSAGFGVHYKPTSFLWPPQLEDLTISGGIDAHFLHGVVAFPQTLRSLTIEHCPLAKGYAVTHLLRTAVRPLRNLESFKIRQMPRLGSRSLDDVLFLLPQIHRLSISVDYISPAFLDERNEWRIPKESIVVPSASASSSHSTTSTPSPTPSTTTTNRDPSYWSDLTASSPLLRDHPLHTLELTSSGATGAEDKITPVDILIAITDDGNLPHLRRVLAARSLRWGSSSTAGDSEALTDALVEGARAGWERERSGGSGLGEGGVEGQVGEWERGVGVWEIDG
ncbi:hypothetical protein BAUCODRAFT_121027 [Baudoinia panamericana UAMH 10762]|uniref:F-box domain-containing protein n=1 Tax=Baudoinia panamericana (strain UAMH 10762) TaxID=717646 RepID=M2NGK5_BAUPA|nr:uncharacterized protein BAUCODRAFT_121027 [Baudoinia panamericana UAMH 10762]EMC98130.1 hypothetical protein BAUCODRAFT_121027 [Baudoinia panamericana UAMH 10762]